MEKKVNELAQELNLDIKKFTAFLKDIGLSVKNSKSKLEEEELDVVFSELTEKYAVSSMEEMLKEAGKTKEEVKEKKEPAKKP